MKTEFDSKLEVNKEEVKKHAKESEEKVSFSDAVKNVKSYHFILIYQWRHAKESE